MEAAFNEEYVAKHRCPSGLILFYEQMVKLVEIAFADLPVYQQVAGEKKNSKDSLAKFEEPIYGNKENGYKESINTTLHCIAEPSSLSFKERQNPEGVFIAFFELQDLTEWKELLHQLMDAGLSNHSIVVVADPGILPASWMQLQKLIDVSYHLYTQCKQQNLKNKAVEKSAEDTKKKFIETTEPPVPILKKQYWKCFRHSGSMSSVNWWTIG